MKKYLNNLIVLIAAPILTSVALGAELPQSKFDGMQLAWVRLPSSNSEETAVVAPKPKTKPQKKTVKPKAVKPVSPSAIVPAPAATVVTPKAVVKPEAVPVTAPKEHPAIVKPVPVHVDKPAPTHARKEASSFEWLVGMGLDMGGEELGTVTFSDGSTAPVNANSGIVLNVGGVIRNGKNNPFSTQFRIGYKSGGPKIWNRDVNWTVIPLEVTEDYKLNSVHLGLGISYQLNPQLKVDLPSSSFVSKYNNALGLVAQIGWIPLGRNYSIDFRYTSVKFQSSDTPDAPSVSGSVSGLFATFYY